MSKRGWFITGLVVAAAAGTGAMTRDHWWPQGASAQAPARAPQVRTVPVDVATATRKQVPLRLEALGTVSPVASVAIKSRVETEIVGVHFSDGAAVTTGDLLFTLDGRAMEAQIQQAEGVLARDQAQLEGMERDIRRFTELLARNAGTRVSVENAETQAHMLRGSIKASESVIRNLRVQLGYTKIYAPIAGRISVASVKVGNFVRPADPVPLATIVQTKPVYVTFGLPQRSLPEVRQALQRGSSRVEATVPGEVEPSVGKLAMVDNTVDPTTGMITTRALMDNEGEPLWPGTLVNVALTVRSEEAVTVPSVAVQVGQAGTYVFIVKDGAAAVRPVRVARTLAGESVISEGLEGGEVVVTDGQLLLANGTKVSPRRGRAGA
jgi:RND family efflux transporter MFP subunit